MPRKKTEKKPVVRFRRREVFTLDPDSARWVRETAEKLHLPASRVVELCIESERASISGQIARGLLSTYVLAKEGVIDAAVFQLEGTG